LATLLREAWGISSKLIYSGLVARAENQAVLKYLTPEWKHSDVMPNFQDYTAIAQVDTQPGAGNNRLNQVHSNHIVIDHHYPLRDVAENVTYSDIRTEMGATVTMMYQYLEAAGIEPDPTLATAMFYGLKTDTRSLSRGASSTDEVAFLKLLHKLDQQKLSKVELAGLSRDYFQAFSRGLHETRVFGKVIVTRLGTMSQPDFTAEMADILIRLQDTHAALCIGQYEGILHLSLRTKSKKQNAGKIIQKIITSSGKAGGHGTMAGGQIPIKDMDVESLRTDIEQRFLAAMGETDVGDELIP